MMKVSIITVVYNNATEIRSAIESVLSQSYQHIEYIVIDGDSTDGTLDIIKSYNLKIGVFISEKDKGLYDAMNKGIMRATGDIIGFLHSDDIFENEHVIANIVESFQKNDCDAVYGDLVYVSKHDASKIIRYWKSDVFDIKKFIHGWMPAHPTLYIRHKIYQQYGLFDITFKISADYDFIIRTLGSGKLNCVYLPIIITRMRTGGASNKSLKNIRRKSSEDLRALKKNNMGGWYTLCAKNISKLKQFGKRSPA